MRRVSRIKITDVTQPPQGRPREGLVGMATKAFLIFCSFVFGLVLSRFILFWMIKNKFHRGIIEELPLDCCGEILLHYSSSKDMFSLFLTVSGLHHYASNVFPRCCGNIEFFWRGIDPPRPLKYISRMKSYIDKNMITEDNIKNFFPRLRILFFRISRDVRRNFRTTISKLPYIECLDIEGSIRGDKSEISIDGMKDLINIRLCGGKNSFRSKITNCDKLEGVELENMWRWENLVERTGWYHHGSLSSEDETLSKLRFIELSKIRIQKVCDLPNLEILKLYECYTFENLKNLPNLRKFFFIGIIQENDTIQNLPKLEHFHFQSTENSSLRYIKNLPSLKILSILDHANMSLTNTMSNFLYSIKLCGLNQLEKLELDNCARTEVCDFTLKNLKFLLFKNTEIIISQKQIDSCSNLEDFVFHEEFVNRDSLFQNSNDLIDFYDKHPKLKSMEVHYDKENRSLPTPSKLLNFEFLSLKGSFDLQNLKFAPKLEDLELFNKRNSTPTLNLAQSISTLSRLPCLTQLSLTLSFPEDFLITNKNSSNFRNLEEIRLRIFKDSRKREVVIEDFPSHSSCLKRVYVDFDDCSRTDFQIRRIGNLAKLSIKGYQCSSNSLFSIDLRETTCNVEKIIIKNCKLFGEEINLIGCAKNRPKTLKLVGLGIKKLPIGLDLENLILRSTRVSDLLYSGVKFKTISINQSSCLSYVADVESGVKSSNFLHIKGKLRGCSLVNLNFLEHVEVLYDKRSKSKFRFLFWNCDHLKDIIFEELGSRKNEKIWSLYSSMLIVRSCKKLEVVEAIGVRDCEIKETPSLKRMEIHSTMKDCKLVMNEANLSGICEVLFVDSKIRQVLLPKDGCRVSFRNSKFKFKFFEVDARKSGVLSIGEENQTGKDQIEVIVLDD